MNESTGIAMLGSGERAVMVPLASPKIKIGEEWRTLPHCVPAIGKDPYLPVDVLTSLDLP